MWSDRAKFTLKERDMTDTIGIDKFQDSRSIATFVYHKTS